jgi:hypothetical protein
MARASLLQAACAAAMLAATPVLAQTSTNMGDTGTTDQSTMPAPQDSTSGRTGGHSYRSTHRSAMEHNRGMRGDSQSAEVDRLNQQSYEAAQRGQAFGSTGSSGMSTSPGGSGSMNDMSGGSMNSGGAMDSGSAPAADGGKM